MAMEALRVAAKESKVMKFVLGAFIFVAVGGLVFSSISSYFTGNVGQSDVAKVGDMTITLQEFDRDLRNVLQQTGMSPQEAYEAGLVNAYLDGRINNLLQLQAARDLDLHPDNNIVGQQIRTMFGDMPRDQIEAMIRAQGMTETQLAQTIRSGIITRYVTVLPLAVANYVPDYIVDADAKIRSERRDATVYTVPLTALVDDAEITDAEIQQYYQDNIDQFTLPERRSFIIGSMTTDMIKTSLAQITEEDIQSAYDDEAENFTVPENRTVSQAMVKDPDTAQAIYEETLAGEDLKTAVENATGSDEAYKTGLSYQETGLPENMSEKLFAETVKKGDVIPPVKTLVGYTIMVVDGINPSQQKPYEDVKEEIRVKLSQTQLYDGLYNKMVETEDMIDAGQGFDDIAGKTGLKTEQTNSYTEEDILNLESGIMAEIAKASPAIIDELFGLPERGVTYPLEMNDSNYVVIGVRDVTEETAKSIDAVRNDIIQALRLENREQKAIALLDEQIKSSKTVQLPSSVTTKTYKDVSRSSENENNSLIYNTAMGQMNYRIEGDSAIIAKIDNVNYIEGENNIDKNSLRENQRKEIDSLLSNYFRTKIGVSVNEDLLRNTYSVDISQ
tara:strand:+ start:534 stop:2381 length:1848 start_codon:yes stop_codon:yes gene_type:complete